MSWFEVDKGGLQQLLEGKDKSFVIRELVQNALDEPGISEIDVEIAGVPNKPLARIKVRDDAPEGFYDLRHAYTLYAKTRKRPDPEKRGRFNLGEKQVLAIAKEARITTTTGTVDFRANGDRAVRRTEVTDQGSLIDVILPVTRGEITEMFAAVKTFIVPKAVKFTVNGNLIIPPEMITSITATLTTENEDTQGQWRRSQRKTTVEVYKPATGAKPMLYELGLPVVELEGGDPWHLNVMQRVPLNSDRDNVSPAFIRDLRAEVLNTLAGTLTEDQAAESWVSDATDDERITPKAVRTIVTKKFGENAVVADPNDPLSRERAIQAGYTIVPARSMSAATWANVRKAEAVPSSSAAFGSIEVGATVLGTEECTKVMLAVAEMARRIADNVWRLKINVQFYRSEATTQADWTVGTTPTMGFNTTRLGTKWFSASNLDDQVALIIHELGHHRGGHLDARYIQALCEIGATLFGMERWGMLHDINPTA